MASEAQLQAMGLSLNEDGDGTLQSSGNWNEKLTLHALIKKSTLTEDKPILDSYFSTAVPVQKLTQSVSILNMSHLLQEMQHRILKKNTSTNTLERTPI